MRMQPQLAVQRTLRLINILKYCLYKNGRQDFQCPIKSRPKGIYKLADMIYF